MNKTPQIVPPLRELPIGPGIATANSYKPTQQGAGIAKGIILALLALVFPLTMITAWIPVMVRLPCHSFQQGLWHSRGSQGSRGFGDLRQAKITQVDTTWN